MSPFQAALEVTADLNPGIAPEVAVERTARAAEGLWDRGFVLVSARRHLAIRVLPWIIAIISTTIGVLTGPLANLN